MNLIKLLYKSYDSYLTSNKEVELKINLLSSKELAQKKYNIDRLRMELMIYKTNNFSTDFENRIKQKIHNSIYPQIFIYNEIKFAFKKIIFASVITGLILFGINFVKEGKINFDEIFGKQKIKIEDALYYEFSSLDKNLLGEKNGL